MRLLACLLALWFLPASADARTSVTSYTWYVATNGSDTGRAGQGGCGSGTEFATPYGAIRYIAANIDLAGNQPTIQLCNGYYSIDSTQNFFGSPVGSWLYILQGDCSNVPATEMNVVLRYTGAPGGTLIQSRDLGIGVLQCLTVDTINPGADTAFYAAQFSVLDINSVRVGAFRYVFMADALGAYNIAQYGAVGASNPGITLGGQIGELVFTNSSSKFSVGTFIDMNGVSPSLQFMELHGGYANFTGGFLNVPGGGRGSLCDSYAVLVMNGLTPPGGLPAGSASCSIR
ncbi:MULTISPECIES: hypothetical protein [unclassified Bradyrhizobium]|uniref:hypothetical protein n=1 Tax=unclassified Bradyrhizobium TaxID=2631580 RepID=UPI0028E60ADD|nr:MULTISPECIES: hypothetical protein [unclassified Bradyrhizobium]